MKKEARREAAAAEKQIISTTREEREKFVNEMKVMLVANDYGFTPAPSGASRSQGRAFNGEDVITYENVTGIKAIKELMIRLRVFALTGKNDQGMIDFPEANRKIDYSLNGHSIQQCGIRLTALSKESPYIFK